YKYMTGTFKTIEGAAKHKAKMLMKGYEGAFITVYKDGERVSLKKAGASPQDNATEIVEVPDNQPISGVTKQLVVYRVQVGAFKNNTSAQLEKFENLKTTKISSRGFNRYLAGEFADYESASKYKTELLQNKTVEEAFVIAFFNGRIISLVEAAELLKN
ncbi:MAG TPA: SPOR domain-containing protein, partial [Bacteroidia bacterium]|nr:SPOR domain-containing protein [Bacteroidia bacterium]